MINDLREFISKVKELGDVQEIEGADWDKEIGAVHDVLSASNNPPLLIFDKIKGYKAGYRVATHLCSTPRRTALALGLPLETKGVQLVKALREKLRGMKLIPPVRVETGPVKENVLVGDEVDLYKFPAPLWRENKAAGRFIGTATAVVTRDPEAGWLNLGAYRVQIHNKNTATISMGPGHHGNIIRKRYWDQGLNCPVAVCCGQDPLIFAAASATIPWGTSEYDYAGGLRGSPVQVTKGVTTDLLVPATAEIVIEGEIVPFEVETLMEGGCLGEWAGYFNPIKPLPAFRVKSIIHRNNPIIHGAPPAVRPSTWTVGKNIFNSAMLWDLLDTQIPGVKGVWIMEEGAANNIVVISVAQQYPGHAKQAALITSGCLPTAYQSEYIIVVDDDVDPSDTAEVLWAIATRCDPEKSVDIIRGLWGGQGNPQITPEQRLKVQTEHSAALILACKPYYRLKDYAVRVKTSPELAQRVKEKWPVILQYFKR